MFSSSRHARKRARERYGFDLDVERQGRVVAMIQGRECRVIRRCSKRVVVHEVEVDGVRLPVMYDRKRGVIITVLPEKALADS